MSGREPWAGYSREDLTPEDMAQIRWLMSEWDDFRGLAELLKAGRRFFVLAGMLTAIGLAAGFYLAGSGVLGG